jgi:hypothetical protein
MFRLRTAIIIAGVVLASIFSLPALADGVPTLSISPASPTVSAGSNVMLDVNIANVTDLFAFQFDLSFAPGTVSAVSIAEGAFLAGGGTTAFIPGTVDNIGGTIAATADTLIGPGPGVNGSGTLAVLTLTGLAPGTSSIDFSSVFLLDSNLTGINSTLQSGSVTVTPRMVPTPEPNSLVMWISGMSVLAFMLLRRR